MDSGEVVPSGKVLAQADAPCTCPASATASGHVVSSQSPRTTKSQVDGHTPGSLGNLGLNGLKAPARTDVSAQPSHPQGTPRDTLD